MCAGRRTSAQQSQKPVLHSPCVCVCVFVYAGAPLVLATGVSKRSGALEVSITEFGGGKTGRYKNSFLGLCMLLVTGGSEPGSAEATGTDTFGATWLAYCWVGWNRGGGPFGNSDRESALADSDIGPIRVDIPLGEAPATLRRLSIAKRCVDCPFEC
jgi:hypothetical protein